jgi:hypothetical protein
MPSANPDNGLKSLAIPAGLEPATLCLEGRSHRPLVNGGCDCSWCVHGMAGQWVGGRVDTGWRWWLVGGIVAECG